MPKTSPKQDFTGHMFSEKGVPSPFRGALLYAFLLFVMLTHSSILVSAQNEIAERYLTQLKQEKFDSIKELKSIGKTGLIKSFRYYTHYYKFNNDPKYLATVCLQMKEIYNKAGVLVERMTLHPFDDEISRFFFANGNLNKIHTYVAKKRANDINNVSFSALEKIRETIVLPNGERKLVWHQNDYIKYKAYKLYDRISFSNDWFNDGSFYPKTVKYWQIRKQKKHFEISVLNPENDSLLYRLELPFINEFIVTEEPSKVRSWLTNNVRIRHGNKLVTVSDNKSQLNYLVDFSFKKILNKPFKECKPITSTQGAEYFWICNDTCALINKKGKEIIPFAKQTLTSSKGDILKIWSLGGYSAYNLKGERLLPLVKSSEAFEISESNIILIRRSFYESKKSGHFYYNALTKDTLNVNGGYPFENEYGVTSIDEKKGIVNSSGEWVVPPNKRINRVQFTGNGYVFIELDEPIWGSVITRDLEHEYVLFNLESRKADTLNVSLRELRNNPKYSLSLCSKLYQNFFENGYALIEVGPDEDKSYLSSRFFTLMDLNGNLIDVKNRYDEIGNGFNKYGQAIVGLEKMTQGKKGEYRSTFFGVIDKSGNEIIPCEYSGLELSKYGYIAHNKDFKYGLIGFDGEIVIQLEATLNDVEFQLDKADNPFIYQLTLPIGGSEKK